MGDFEMFFPDRSALKFTDDGLIEGDWLDCDGCNTPQLVNGGIVSDQVFVCAKCRSVLFQYREDDSSDD